MGLLVLRSWFFVLSPFFVLGPFLVLGPGSASRLLRYLAGSMDLGQRTTDKGQRTDEGRTKDHGRTKHQGLRTKDTYHGSPALFVVPPALMNASMTGR